jgi:hypothetical protein
MLHNYKLCAKAHPLDLGIPSMAAPFAQCVPEHITSELVAAKMKKVRHSASVEPRNPDSPYSAHHLYEVYLGNGRTVLFRSRRDAQGFVADTTRWLNDALLEANTLFAEAHSDYRMAWPLLSDTTAHGMMELDVQIREHLERCTWHLDHCTNKGRSASGLHNGWRHIRLSLERSAAAFGGMETFYQYKTQGVLRWRMAMRKRQCETMLERMKDYATDRPLGAHSVTTGVQDRSGQ